LIRNVQKLGSALISVYHKDGLEPVVRQLHDLGVKLYSTGGTQTFIEALGIPVTPVETVTGFPSILDGRVKTLHPMVFGGILWRRDRKDDRDTVERFGIPSFDMVIVDLYPFEDTVASGASEEDIIEKIDIGGISLIRAAAKNFAHCWIVSSRNQYAEVLDLLQTQQGSLRMDQRKAFAGAAFQTSQHYDAHIASWTLGQEQPFATLSGPRHALRYGENPHQKAWFVGDLSAQLEQISGKELSFNNLLDVEAALDYCADGNRATVAVIKHNNACGMASRPSLLEAWNAALAADPVSAFGGVIACNQVVDLATAEAMNSLFFEVLLAPGFAPEALELLQQKKNRILVKTKDMAPATHRVRSVLNGVLIQERDYRTDAAEDLRVVTQVAPTEDQVADLLYASAISKHTKSNTIVLVKDQQLIAAGTGQTSRVDALQQAIHKAKSFGMSLKGAVMASDAFFPFPDCVEIAYQEGITAVIQPGGSVKDDLSVQYCDQQGMAMVMTGIRHFKH
jgi:phosphoribosylaminoimidazolecarboxamide formyltransferase/IMP cyclohydrolase